MATNHNSKDAFAEFLVPGSRVWIKVLDPAAADGKGKKIPVATYGTDGNLTYAGYQYMATKTLFIFDSVKPNGKRTQLTSFAINGDHLLYCGLVDPKNRE